MLETSACSGSPFCQALSGGLGASRPPGWEHLSGALPWHMRVCGARSRAEQTAAAGTRAGRLAPEACREPHTQPRGHLSPAATLLPDGWSAERQAQRAVLLLRMPLPPPPPRPRPRPRGRLGQLVPGKRLGEVPEGGGGQLVPGEKPGEAPEGGGGQLVPGERLGEAPEGGGVCVGTLMTAHHLCNHLAQPPRPGRCLNCPHQGGDLSVAHPQPWGESLEPSGPWAVGGTHG